MFVILRNGGKQVGESEEYERHDEIDHAQIARIKPSIGDADCKLFKSQLSLLHKVGQSHAAKFP